MRKVILYFNMSLDGIVTNLENWAKISDELIEDSALRYEEIDTILFGANTYPFMGEYWQNAEANSNSPTEKSFAKLINDKKKYVISRKKIDLTWRNSEQILFTDTKSLIEKIQNLKNQTGKNISVESGVKTWQFFLENKLYDELARRLVTKINFSSHAQNIEIIIDQSKNQVAKETFNKIIKAQLLITITQKINVIIRHRKSHEDLGLQCVDIF